MFKCCVSRSSRDESLTQSDYSENSSSSETSSSSSSSSSSSKSSSSTSSLSNAPNGDAIQTTLEKVDLIPVEQASVTDEKVQLFDEPVDFHQPIEPLYQVPKINRCTSPVDELLGCSRCPGIRQEGVEKGTGYSPQEVKKDIGVHCEIIGAAQIDLISEADDDSEKLKSFNQDLKQSGLPKLPFSGPAYIERTICDGPEEEGDDSVFESCQAKSIVDENVKIQAAASARWNSREESEDNSSEGFGGMQEPPATPVARDELALKRHRFFSDLLEAADFAAEHKVRFDPLGPTVYTGVESSGKEEQLEELVIRLENVTSRLEQISTNLPVHPETQEIGVQTNNQIQVQSLTTSEEELPPPPIENLSDCAESVEHLSDSAQSQEALSECDVAGLNCCLPAEPELNFSLDAQLLDNPTPPLPVNLPSPEPAKSCSPQPSVKSASPDIVNSCSPPLQPTPPPPEQLTDCAEVKSQLACTPPPPAHVEQTDSPTSISPEEQYSPSPSTGSTDSCIASTVVDTVVEITNMSIAGYQDLMIGPIRDYMNLSAKIGGDVAQHSKLVEKAFEIQFQFIQMSSSRAQPNQSEQMSLLAPTSQQIQLIQEFREKHRGSPLFNHLSAISESIPALGWVAISPTPGPYVKEMNDAGQFYTNRVLKEWKEKDKTHVEWCKAWVQTLTDLQQYVKAHHTTGLVWAKGSAAGVPPPPPSFANAPPPPPFFANDVPTAGNDDRSALFAQINQGENITRNLKKVTADMQTHKNTSLRTGPAPFKAPSYANSGSPVKTVLPANAPIDKPPVFQKDNKKWLVEYQKGNKNLVIDETEMNNVVYMFRCQDSTLVVKGKVNSIVMDSCRKSSVVFDSVVSSVEFVNCQSVQMQVLGKVPTVSVDKTDGCQVFLSKNATDVEIITSKSSEMNIMVPSGIDGDYVEHAVPEQFKTTIGPKGLVTVAVDSLG